MPLSWENAITKLAQQAAPRLAETPSLQAALQWITQSFHQQHYGEGLDLVLEDADSGKLILTPVVLQKSASGLALEVAFRYPVSVTEEQVLAGVQRHCQKGKPYDPSQHSRVLPIKRCSRNPKAIDDLSPSNGQ